MISNLGEALSPAATALSVAIVNAVWQGAFIGLIAAWTLAAMSRRSARARYSVACLALAGLLLVFTVTFGLALRDAIEVSGVASTSPTHVSPGGIDVLPVGLDWWPAEIGRPPSGIDGLPLGFTGDWLAIAWLGGAVIVALSSLFQIAAVRRLAREARIGVSDRWSDAFEAVSRDLHLERLASLGHSAAVEVPTVVGWLAPIVLVPLSTCTALSRDQMCAILAHELAHVRRRDYLVNAVQKVVEVLLFFHPVTWWLSHRIRNEREFCCDDLAVQYTHSALAYARALSQLETLRTQRPGFAMGADGGSLMNRIARIVGAKPQQRQMSFIGAALGSLVLAVIGIAFLFGNGGVAFAGDGTATPGPTAKPAEPVETDAASPEIVAAARSALDQLVANGTISQSQEDAIMQAVASGSVNAQTFIDDGVVTDAQMQAVRDALIQVKQSFADNAEAAGGTTVDGQSDCDAVASKLAQAVKDGKLSQDQADQQLAACSSGDTAVLVSPGTDCDAVAAKLAQAVDDGHLTQQEADETLAACSGDTSPK